MHKASTAWKGVTPTQTEVCGRDGRPEPGEGGVRGSKERDRFTKRPTWNTCKAIRTWKIKPDEVAHVGSHSTPSSTSGDKTRVWLRQGLSVVWPQDESEGASEERHSLCTLPRSAWDSFFLPILGVKEPKQKLNTRCSLR